MSLWPALIVFDLDNTLWPWRIDFHFTPPFEKDKSGRIVDSNGRIISFHEEVPSIFEKLRRKDIKIGIASCSPAVESITQLLYLLDWDKYISYKEMYPSCKVTHFEKIQNNSGTNFSEMIFFDDMPGNIDDVEQLGVLSVLVENGMTMKVLQRGLKLFEQKKNYK